jgi:DNA-binding CsgD family transcriptional regulator
LFTTLLLFSKRREQGYFLPLSWFLLTFTFIFLLYFFRDYLMVNVEEFPLYFVFVSHGITNALFNVSIFLGIRVFHQVYKVRRRPLEIVFAALTFCGAVLMLLPGAVTFNPSDQLISFFGLYYLTLLAYMIVFTYMLFFSLYNIRHIKKVHDKFLVILLTGISLFGWIECTLSFIEDLQVPYLVLQNYIDDFPLFTLPFLVLSIYLMIKILASSRISQPNTEVLIQKGREMYHLSPRETEILTYLFQGHGNNKIADLMCVSLATIKTHINNIFKKTEVKSRFELVRKLGNTVNPPKG